MTMQLNRRALAIADRMVASAEELRIEVHRLDNGTRVIDCGVKTAGGLSAGLMLSRVCLADLAEVMMAPMPLAGSPWSAVQVSTDHPVAACMASQYAGWQISVGKYFGMGSGPMRALSGREPLFEKIGLRETDAMAVGVIEARKLPDEPVAQYIAERAGIEPSQLTLLCAPTASLAGGAQIAARSVETAIHKLHELGFDIHRIVSAWGIAPLPPVGKDDLEAIGRTNDAVLYGACVLLHVRGDRESIEQIGPKVPSCASSDYGAPFREIFRRAGGDFYKIDPHLFSPAQITLCHIESGTSWQFGQLQPTVLAQSFGLPSTGGSR